MSTKFLRSGNDFTPVASENLNVSDLLPAGNYGISTHPMRGLYFTRIDDFAMPPKIYGDTLQKAERILSTFDSRPATTGVLLTGEKGSGKTLLSKQISVQGAVSRGLPTIVVNQPLSGEDFFRLIQGVEQPAIVFFDEFEKVYDKEEQLKLLTLLDGVYPSKKLFVLTCNDEWQLNDFMKNRPGRIFYKLDYKGLDETFVREYCQDELKNKDHTEKVVQVAGIFGSFNFDMLKALVEEMNRYGESPQDALKMLNIKASYEEDAKYDVSFFKGNTALDSRFVRASEYDGNPLTMENWAVSFYNLDKLKAKSFKPTEDQIMEAEILSEPENVKWVHWNKNHLTKLDVKTKTYEFEAEGFRAVFARKKQEFGFYHEFASVL